VASGKLSKEDVQRAMAYAKFKVYDAEMSNSPALDVLGLSALLNGKVHAVEETIKGVVGVSESALSQVRSPLIVSLGSLTCCRQERSCWKERLLLLPLET
jgi:hypothetical protein